MQHQNLWRTGRTDEAHALLPNGHERRRPSLTGDGVVLFASRPGSVWSGARGAELSKQAVLDWQQQASH